MKTVKIEVIGSGCKKCKALFELTKEVAIELNIKDTILYSTDIDKIVTMGVMSSPVLAIDDKPVLVGVLPDREKLKDLLCKNVLSEDEKDKLSLSKTGGCCSCGCKC